jgi:nucleoside-diphosphate-sugar epimerase
MTLILVTGSTGVLGRVTVPCLEHAGHQLKTPASGELDLFDAEAVQAAVHGAEAVIHLATRIPPPERMDDPTAWGPNDRLRDEAVGLLVDATLATGTDAIIVPTVAFVYPPGPADETTAVGDIPDRLRSALAAEHHLERVTAAGRRGVALRLGSLYGPLAATDSPSDRYRAHLHTGDAGAAIAAAVDAPAGMYNVVDDADEISHHRYTDATGWRPLRGR